MTDQELLQAMSDMLKPILEKVTNIEETVNKNYDKTLEFYGQYKEDANEIKEQLAEVQVRQEIFENQTIKNTAKLKLIK